MRVENSSNFCQDDRLALSLMRDFIVKQTQHRNALEAVSESHDGLDKMLLNQVERESGNRVRNYAPLTIEKSQNEREKDSNINPKNIWKNPYFSNAKPKSQTKEDGEAKPEEPSVQG